jgi:hypothetical protein
MSRIDLDQFVEDNKKLLTDGKINGRPEREAMFMAFFLSNPLQVAVGPRLAWAGDHARNEAIEAFPDRPIPAVFDAKGNRVSNASLNDVDGHRDATRHIIATIQAMKATNIPGVGDPETGFQFMQARETYKGNNPVTAAMDMHNNAVGAEIYRRNPNATDQQFVELARQAVTSGRAVVVDRNGDLEWSDRVRPYQHGSAEHSKSPANKRGDLSMAEPSSDLNSTPAVPRANVADALGPNGEKLFNHLHGKIGELGVATNGQQLDKFALDLTVQSMAAKLTDAPNVHQVGSTLFAYSNGPDGNRAQIDMNKTVEKDPGQIVQEGRQVVATNTQQTAMQQDSQELKPRGLTA